MAKINYNTFTSYERVMHDNDGDLMNKWTGDLMNQVIERAMETINEIVNVAGGKSTMSLALAKAFETANSAKKNLERAIDLINQLEEAERDHNLEFRADEKSKAFTRLVSLTDELRKMGYNL